MVKRTLILIDGENLVFRYQELLKQGRIPRKEVIHVPDVFVWSPHVCDSHIMHVLRANYYTSCVGDETHLDAMRRKIQAVPYYFKDATYTTRARLIPRVYKKSQKRTKSRLVDIQITLDALVAAYTTEIDEFYLITGDGDFIGVIEQLMRIGKSVKVNSLSSGLAQGLDIIPDYFQVIDDDFFEKQPESKQPNLLDSLAPEREAGPGLNKPDSSKD